MGLLPVQVLMAPCTWAKATLALWAARDLALLAVHWAAAALEQPVPVPVPVYPCTTEADLSCREGKQAASEAP